LREKAHASRESVNDLRSKEELCRMTQREKKRICGLTIKEGRKEGMDVRPKANQRKKALKVREVLPKDTKKKISACRSVGSGRKETIVWG